MNPEQYSRSVTVGICTKNNHMTVGRTAESIAGLDYPRELLEIVVVDGLSTDDTVEVASRTFERAGLRFSIISDEGRGLGYARQLLLERAHGEFIAFVDADHYLHRSWLKNSVRTLDAKEDYAVVRGVQGITRGLSIPAALENYLKYFEEMDVAKGKAAIKDFGIAGSLIRKSAIDDVGGFDSSFLFAAEDTDLGVRLAKKGWRITTSVDSIFFHYSRPSWRGLYKQYREWGRGFALVSAKHNQVFERQTALDLLSSSLVAIALSSRYIPRIYRATKNAFCVLMPIHFAFKRIAWLLGYLGTSRIS